MFFSYRFHTNEKGLVQALVEAGAEVRYLVNTSKYSEDHDVVVPEVLGFARSLIPLDTDSAELKWGLFPLSAYRTLLVSRPDVVVIKGFRFAALLLSLFARLIRVPLIAHVQRPLYAKPERLLKRLWYRCFGRDVITPIERVTRPGEVAGPQVRDRNTFMLGQRWRYLPFVVESNPGAVAREYRRGGRTNFLIVGKYVSRKMIPETIRALKSVADGHPVSVTVVGSFLDDSVYQDVQALAAESDAMEIRVSGPVPHHEMTQLYLDHDVLLMTSVGEPASCSQLEAMAQGVMPVCSSDNGTASYIRVGVTGYVFDAGDFDANLRDVLARILKDPAQVEKMGRVAAERVGQDFSADPHVRYFFERAGTRGKTS